LAGQHRHAAHHLCRRPRRQRVPSTAHPAPVRALATHGRDCDGARMTSLEAVVRELRWSDTRTSAARYLVHGVVAGVGCIFAVLAVSRVVPLEQTLRIAALGVPLALLAVAVAWVAARPSSASLMRK